MSEIGSKVTLLSMRQNIKYVRDDGFFFIIRNKSLYRLVNGVEKLEVDWQVHPNSLQYRIAPIEVSVERTLLEVSKAFKNMTQVQRELFISGTDSGVYRNQVFLGIKEEFISEIEGEEC